MQAGIAGEYFVAAELSRRGYIASLTMKSTRGVDILASDAHAKRTVAIQVKTAQSDKPAWLLNSNVEKQRAGRNLMFVFVLIPQDAPPEYFIVPRRDVVAYTKQNNKEWLSKLKSDGTRKKENGLRYFRDLECKYQNKWSHLGLDDL